VKRRRLYFPIFSILVLACAILFFTDITGLDLIPGLPRLRFQQTTTFSTSSVTLSEVRALYELSTLEYVYRFVFPHDFLPEGQSIQEITRRLRGQPEGAEVEEILSADELLYLRTYNLATDVGLEHGGDFDFVVITLVMTAGFDVSEEPFGSDEAFVTSEYRDDQGVLHRRIEVPYPEAKILSTTVEDIVPDDYPYPDLPVGADSWRRITEYVRTQPLDDEVLTRILRTAEENGIVFLDQLLRSAGFDDVIFSEKQTTAR
jgi:hypothetical protein